MDRHPRKTVAIELGEELSVVLGALRRDAGCDAAAELDVDRVRDTEAVVGCRIPDPWLALLAADVPAVRDVLDLGLGRIPAHTKQAHQGKVQRDFVAVGAEDGHLFYGFLHGREPHRMVVFNRDRRSLQAHDVATWVRDRFFPGDVAGAEPFAPRLVRRVDGAGTDGVTIVRHAKWGEGKVLAELGTGPLRKVKAEFPGLGLKTVQARFLEFPDD